MGDLHVDERNSPPVASPEEMAGRFHGELIGAMPEWKRRLSVDPSRLTELEHDVHDAFSRGADLVLAGMIALTMKQPGFDEACEQTRQNDRERMPLYREHRTLLRNGQWRRVVEELTGLAEMAPENEDVLTEIAQGHPARKMGREERK